jgi:hypothetical protein
VKISSAPNPTEPDKLKPLLHEKIERMDREQLALLDRVLLQLEAEDQAARLVEACDADAARGTFARATEIIQEFRAQHRYA